VKLLIIDRSKVVYGRLIDLLGGVATVNALAVAHSLNDSYDKVQAINPSTIIIDIDFCDEENLKALRQLRRQLPGSNIYIFSNHAEYKSVLLSLGMDAFFDKSLEFELLVQQLKQDIEDARNK
jgi:DNA-binding NarL/FixJ family response regulator